VSLLRALRSLVLGDTWTVPLGVALTVAAAAALAHVGAWFHALAGLALLAGTLLTLAAATLRLAKVEGGATDRDDPGSPGAGA